MGERPQHERKQRRIKRTVRWSMTPTLHTPAEDFKHDRGSVSSQETDTGIHDDLGQDCQGG